MPPFIFFILDTACSAAADPTAIATTPASAAAPNSCCYLTVVILLSLFFRAYFGVVITPSPMFPLPSSCLSYCDAAPLSLLLPRPALLLPLFLCAALPVDLPFLHAVTEWIVAPAPTKTPS